MRLLVLPVILLFAPLLALGPIIGVLVDPFASFRLSGRSTAEGAVSGPAPDPGNLAGHGFVSDGQRYQLARFVGWSPADAIVATAISIAENGSGDPAARCFNCVPGVKEDSRGLWQVNALAHPQFSNVNLYDPQTNANAAHAIYLGAGWGAWSTYLNGSYRAYLGRAQAAAQTQLPTEQA